PLFRSSSSSSSRSSPTCRVRRVTVVPALSGASQIMRDRLGPRHFLAMEELDLVAHLDVVETVQAKATLVAGRNFADIVLEALERADTTLEHHRTTAKHAGTGVPVDLAVEHVEPGDDLVARKLER